MKYKRGVSGAYMILFMIICSFFYTACEREIDVKTGGNNRQLIVEGYINNLDPRLNYVVLTRSFGFASQKFSIEMERKAEVYITEGSIISGDTIWNLSTRKQLFELDTFPGVYFDFSAFINASDALKGREGYIYRMEIYTNSGEKVLGYTYIPYTIYLDSVTFALSNVIEDTSYRMTIHYMEPAVRGNNYRLAYFVGNQSVLPFLPDSLPALWGSFDDNKDFYYNDDIVNGVYRRVTLSGKINNGDTVHMFLGQIDRKTYNFWESVLNATNNGGPFSTPVKLESNISGAIGTFSGYSYSYKKLIFKK